jgi:hypothetical protein
MNEFAKGLKDAHAELEAMGKSGLEKKLFEIDTETQKKIEDLMSKAAKARDEIFNSKGYQEAKQQIGEIQKKLEDASRPTPAEQIGAAFTGRNFKRERDELERQLADARAQLNTIGAQAHAPEAVAAQQAEIERQIGEAKKSAERFKDALEHAKPGWSWANNLISSIGSVVDRLKDAGKEIFDAQKKWMEEAASLAKEARSPAEIYADRIKEIAAHTGAFGGLSAEQASRLRGRAFHELESAFRAEPSAAIERRTTFGVHSQDDTALAAIKKSAEEATKQTPILEQIRQTIAKIPGISAVMNIGTGGA